jgi:energy-coupling factor transporter ATP-binding protein EcfA2
MTTMYHLSIEQCHNLIATVGTETAVLVQGHMGTGKSSILKMFETSHPTHTRLYFDGTTKDLGDIALPKLKDLDGHDYVRFATNEELGMHLQDQPTVLMIDEYGKANPAVKNALLRLLQERQIGSYELHPDTIVFATTNLGNEGVGDILPPHARNRIMVVTMRKPTHIEWIEWAINAGLDHSLLGWVRDNPHLFQSFDEVSDPNENPYIYHPRAVGRTSFVTPRSLEKAAHLLAKRDRLDDVSLLAGLMGLIGDRSAMDLMAFVRLADDLPTLESIKKDPANAKVPETAAAVCMVVYRTLSAIETGWVDQWFEYLDRLPSEAQSLFVNGVRASSYSKRPMLMTHKALTAWARNNGHLFAADV